MDPDYDLIIRDGTVVDGRGGDPYSADVAVKDGVITAIGDLDGQSADRVIQLDGEYVAPGFIDMHAHADLAVFEPTPEGLNRGDVPKIKQGVTTQVTGQDGLSVVPVRDADKEELARKLGGVDGALDPADWDWNTMGEYLDRVDAHTATNVASLVGHSTLREHVMGAGDHAPTDAELVRMKDVLESSMEEGAYGLSSGLIYPPACYADSPEVEALCSTVAEHDGIFMVHIRNESDYVVESLKEVLEVGKKTGVHVHISHLKAAGSDNWAKADEMIKLIDSYRDEGMNVTSDMYPYTAGSTMLGAVLPPWVHDGGTDATLVRLANPLEREQMIDDMLAQGPCDWDNFYKFSNGGWEGIYVSSVSDGSPYQGDVGKSIAEICREKGIDPTSRKAFHHVFDLLQNEEMGVSMIAHSMSEENKSRFLQLPYQTVSTDGLVMGKPHPRLYGSFPRVLAKYARDEGVLTLPEAVQMMTYRPAQALGIDDERGSIEVGKRADITVFDYQDLKDNATFEDPCQHPEGIDYVLVNGKVAYDNHDGRDELGEQAGDVLYSGA